MQKNNYDDKLFDAVLKIAAEEALAQEIEEMPTCEELNEQFKPSASLDKKIRKIISRRKFKEKASLWRKATVKIAACFAMVLVFSSAVLLSVEATRNYIFNTIIKWQEDYFSIQHENNNTSDIKIYRPTYLPENFVEVSSSVVGDIIKISYENENGITIAFKQSPSEFSHTHKEYTDIKINGKEAYLFSAVENDKNNIILWESNGTIFNFTSEVESAELILMAESIKK